MLECLGVMSDKPGGHIKGVAGNVSDDDKSCGTSTSTRAFSLVLPQEQTRHHTKVGGQLSKSPLFWYPICLKHVYFSGYMDLTSSIRVRICTYLDMYICKEI